MSPAYPRYEYNKPETWEEHLQRFTCLLAAQDITKSEQKKGLLISTLDDTTFRHLKEWLPTGVTLERSTYEQVTAALNDNITPTVNKMVIFAEFLRRVQADGEGADAYMADLKRLVAPLGAAGFAPALVTLRFAVGLRDKEIQQRVFSDPDISQSKALELVLSSERALRNVETVRASFRSSQLEEVQKQLEYVALNSKIEDPTVVALLDYLKDDEKLTDADSKDAVLLQLIPSLCPPTARVIVRKKSFKPSVAESRDAFIAQTTVAADLEALIKRRQIRMATLKAAVQPYMIFLGESRSNIIATYVCIDNVLYKTDSALHCLDLCFKLFHALSAAYPGEANHLWHIFHLEVYKVKHNPTVECSVPMSTKAFIGKLRSYE